MGTVYRGHDKKRTQSTGQNHGTGDSSETDRQKNQGVHGGLRTGSGARIPWSDRDALRKGNCRKRIPTRHPGKAGLTGEDVNRCMVSTESLSPAEQKILAVADPQERLEALAKQTGRFLTHVDAKEILHADRRKKAVSGLKEMLAPERADELRTIADRYQQKLRDYQELSRTDPLLAYFRITMPDCARNGDMLVTHAADGTKVCIGENMLPGGPINSHEGKRTYAMMV